MNELKTKYKELLLSTNREGIANVIDRLEEQADGLTANIIEG